METLMVAVLVASSAMVIFACEATASRGIEVVQHLDVVYATDHAKQRLDVFRPADNPKAPLVIWIHGGGWFRGSRSWTHQNAVALAQSGCAVASLGYRLVTDYPDWKTMAPSMMWSNMKSDLMHGAQYLVDHADTLGIDASRAVSTGSSAGGQLALVMKARAAEWMRQGIVSQAPDIVAAVAHAPACVLKGTRNHYLKTLEKGVPPEDIDPMHMPPSGFNGTLIVHGGADTVVPLSQSIRFAEHLPGHGVAAYLAVIPNANHSHIYDVGLDESLSPVGRWLLPPRKVNHKHGQAAFDAAMAFVRRLPGYDLPYTPFYAEPPYRYHGDRAPE